MTLPQNPHVYEINTRVWLRSLWVRYGRRLTLGQVPSTEWEAFRDLGMDALWLMGVWRTGARGVALARAHPDLRRTYSEVLPDWSPADVIGSPYAVAGYEIHPLLGGEEDLARVRDTLHGLGQALVLDFVPNHTAADHPWVKDHPERYVQTRDTDLFGPDEAFRIRCSDGVERLVAHGRDPYFPPWTDTAQLCAPCPHTRRALSGELVRMASLCDGVRCDMAMLPLNRIFSSTWEAWIRKEGTAVPEREFWPEVLAPALRIRSDLVLLAEVYWGLEAELLEQGFSGVYDKNGYDRLRALDAMGFKQSLREEGAGMCRRVRFLENHDEDRMAAAFPREALRSVAVIHAATPGIRLFHHGQLEGRRVRLPVQLGREPEEEPDEEFTAFYKRLLNAVKDPLFKKGEGFVLEVTPAYAGDEGYRSIVAFAYRWNKRRGVVAVNLGGEVGSGYLRFPGDFWQGWDTVPLVEALEGGDTVYVRERTQMEQAGLYVKLEPFCFHFLIAGG